MKITVTSVDAEPSELSEVPELQELLARLATLVGGPETTAGATRTDIGEVENIWHFLELRGRGNPYLDLVKDFVRGCLEFEGAEAILGQSRNSPDGYGDYLMVRHASHIKGAFVYVTPSSGKLVFRLQRDATRGWQHAILVETKDENYQVRVNLKSGEELQEALGLAKLAYDGVTP